MRGPAPENERGYSNLTLGIPTEEPVSLTAHCGMQRFILAARARCEMG